MMFIMRASGAMPIITALQIATASLAVPKSVMKTMAGREAVEPAMCESAWDLAEANKSIPRTKNP